MAAFRAVSHDDQIQLLKGGSIELLILRSVLTFDKDKQQFLDPLDPEEKAAVKVRVITIVIVRPVTVYCGMHERIASVIHSRQWSNYHNS